MPLAARTRQLLPHSGQQHGEQSRLFHPQTHELARSRPSQGHSVEAGPKGWSVTLGHLRHQPDSHFGCPFHASRFVVGPAVSAVRVRYPQKAAEARNDNDRERAQALQEGTDVCGATNLSPAQGCSPHAVRARNNAVPSVSRMRPRCARGGAWSVDRHRRRMLFTRSLRNAALHVFQRHGRAVVLQCAEQSANGSHWQKPDCVVVYDVAHPIPGRHSQRLANGLGERRLPLRGDRRRDHDRPLDCLSP